MRVLLVGSGAREHALVYWLLQSFLVAHIWVARGNAGTALMDARLVTNLDIDPGDIEGLLAVAQSLEIDLVVVGPEQPLIDGIVDEFQKAGKPIFGPSKAAALLEGSKSFACELMEEIGVPCPAFRVFQDYQAAIAYIQDSDAPWVIKADGPAFGKGVFLCYDKRAAKRAVRKCMRDRIFGKAGDTILITELVEGVEISVFGFTDGTHLSRLVAARDRKWLGNRVTGGLASSAPHELWTEELEYEIARTIMQPIIDAMRERGTPFVGVLYAGLMITTDGRIVVLEFNCRLGDPEGPVILALLEQKLVDVMMACVEGRLDAMPVTWGSTPHVGVVMASDPYPDSTDDLEDIEITGWNVDPKQKGTPLLFHGFTTLKNETVVTKRGHRVMMVVAEGSSIEEAAGNVYPVVRQISFPWSIYLSDVGQEEEV